MPGCPASRAPQHRAVDGRLVDLGLVGAPSTRAGPALIDDLLSLGYVPAVACLGATRAGEVLNVNADTLAASLAQRCGASRLIIAGATPGVLDADGSTVETLDPKLLDAMIQDGRAVGRHDRQAASVSRRDDGRRFGLDRGRPGRQLAFRLQARAWSRRLLHSFR